MKTLNVRTEGRIYLREFSHWQSEVIVTFGVEGKEQIVRTISSPLYGTEAEARTWVTDMQPQLGAMLKKLAKEEGIGFEHVRGSP